MIFKKVFEMDKVYDSIEKVNFREAVRAIIIKENKVLMVHCKNGDYKFPGGEIKSGETHIDALKREVQEEAGHIDTIINGQIGIVTQRNKDNCAENSIFEMKSYYYICDISGEKTLQDLDDYEEKLEFRAIWVTIEEAIQNNEAIINSKVGIISDWIYRETYVLKELFNALLC